MSKIDKAPPQDPTAVWVFGIDGWYCAKWLWDAKYAAHLESLGYRVQRSVKRPLEAA